jgi:outer membrane protein assembly factor BamA
VRRTCATITCVLLIGTVRAAAQHEVIAVIHVHGNTISPTDEVIAASGLEVGAPFSESVREDAEERLRTSGRFHDVEVLKRFASISDPTQITVLIQIDDGPVRIDPPSPGPVAPGSGRTPVAERRGPLNVMFAPILTAEDGYGLTYGVRIAVSGHRHVRQRVVVPASWGGDKRIGAELQREFSHRAVPNLRTGAMVQRRTHPFFESSADRKRVWGRADWAATRQIRAGSEIAWERSILLEQRVEARSIAVDLTFDTRIDPLVPLNAIYVRATFERLWFSSRSVARRDVDANGYVGLYRGIVLALRAVHEDMSGPAPAFYKSLLGGSSNLRGFRAGYKIGDTLTAGSAEIRIPLSSALRVVRVGTSVFMDVGSTYDKGQHLEDQKLDRGIGAGVWLAAPLFRASVAVARGLGSGTRVHVGAGLTF